MATPNEHLIRSYQVGLQHRWSRIRFCKLAEALDFTTGELGALVGLSPPLLRQRLRKNRFLLPEAQVLQLIENLLIISITGQPPDRPTALDRFAIAETRPAPAQT